MVKKQKVKMNNEESSVLVAISLLAVARVEANLLVVLLQGGHVLTSLRELALLHSLADVPVDEGALGVHQVELVVRPCPSLGDGSGVGEHAHGALHLRQVATRDHGGGLVVDANLEASGAPVDKLNAALALDGGNGGVHILGDDVTAVQHTAGHVLSMPWVAFDHGVGWLKASIGDLCNTQGLVVSLLGRDYGSIGDKGEVDPRVGHKVGLELVQIDVQGSVEPQRGSDGGDDLADQPVEVGVAWPLNVEVPPADVIDRFVVHHERAVAVLQGGVRAQCRVVRLHNCSGNLWRWVDAELQLGLLAVINRETLHQKRREARSGAAAEGVEDEEALQAGAVVSQLPHSVQHQVNDLLADGVVTAGIVVSGVLLARNHLLRVEKLPVGSGPNLVDDCGLEVEEDGPRNMLAGASFREECGEGIILWLSSFNSRKLTIRLDAVLHAVELPAGVAHLDSSLSNMNGDAFPHLVKGR